MTGIVMKGKDLDTDLHSGRTPCEDGVGYHKPRSYQKLGEGLELMFL